MSVSAWSKKPIKVLVVAVAGLVVAGLAACDSTPAGPVAGPDGPAPRQVTVVGAGKVQGTPDTVTVNAAIESIASDATAAMNQTNERMTAVIDAVVAQGIDRKDVSTTQVTLNPQYADNSVITGYQASNSIAVKIRKVEAASPTIAAVQTAGGNATRINSVNFSIEDDSQLVKDARTRAFEDAKDRAQQYADLSGLGLGNVISITEAGADTPPPMPMPRYGAMEAASAPPLEPGQQTVGFSVTVVWELA
ncbi:SIMPL domain-containing protein [Mycolicibacterium sediminis]|uniref:SIMPL domain-containing protein n=1 Tax=Mycolicibacterium sediminis TaxID=1286180 RepID=A0A7I7QIP9_9MYCO|nr:SIMPL domain-containing protein [Mycolicibacterium sediminis]BBY26209.1 hypothetical protein MSEDJ_03050 [Mycolicibacterium sediminis]